MIRATSIATVYATLATLIPASNERKGARMSALLEEVRESLSLPAPAVARQIREAAGVSQARLAGELGVHELTVYRWETGARTPHGELRRTYARLLAELDQVTRGSEGTGA
jgi:DNA-binding transcriptional regulator YiaG